MRTSNTYETALALSRFGLGSGLEGCDAVRGDVRVVLQDEITRGPLIFPENATLPDSTDILEQFRILDRERAQRRKGLADAIGPLPGLAPGKQFSQELAARYGDGIRAPVVGFSERLVMFWTNHFAVATNKNQIVRLTAGVYEREAIRPHIYGRFKDMLLSAETHPAMLNFLDQNRSVGPESRSGLKAKRGLNENLAREILELHVMGVDGGYTQQDVTAFANALTGWTYRLPSADDMDSNASVRTAFDFVRADHQPGAQKILGHTYRQDGFFQAADIMLDLAERPETARFIAFKLARHFVADTPPQSLVDRLADVFHRTDGNLGLVSQTLIESPEAWETPAVKIRSPQEHLIAMLRSTGVNLSPSSVSTLLSNMGQPLWQPSGPNGFPDTFEAWGTPVGIASRMDVAIQIAEKAPATLDPRAFAVAIIGARLSDQTLTAVSRAENARQGLALALMSPEFMRR